MKLVNLSRVLSAFIVVVLFLIPGFASNAACAQNIQSVPPGGAILLTPPLHSEANLKFESFRTPIHGKAYFVDDKSHIVYEAPTEIKGSGITETVPITIAYQLTGGTAPDVFTINIDPNYSAVVNSVYATALEWLFLLLIIALFIEAAVLFSVALVRSFIRLIGGPSALGPDGPKPSVHKPIFALVLSALVVLGFKLEPLDDIISAFGNDPDYLLGVDGKVFADIVLTILLVAGGAESVRRVATGIMTGLNVPTASKVDAEAIKADTR